MKKVHIFIFLITSISSFSQISLSEKTAKLVLKDLAELDKRRALSINDSTKIVALTQAYYYKDSALTSSMKATEEADWIAKDNEKLYISSVESRKRALKEIKKQKVLKWAALGGMGGGAVAGPPGMAIGFAAGGLISIFTTRR